MRKFEKPKEEMVTNSITVPAINRVYNSRLNGIISDADVRTVEGWIAQGISNQTLCEQFDSYMDKPGVYSTPDKARALKRAIDDFGRLLVSMAEDAKERRDEKDFQK